MQEPAFIINTDEFGGSCEAWHDVGEKIAQTERLILDALCENLTIADYSPRVLEYNVFYICLIPESKFHRPEKGRFYPNNQTILQTFNLNHEQILKASETEVLEIMAKKYLEGILGHEKYAF